MITVRWITFLIVLAMSPMSYARTWTDKTGRTMEAEIVVADEKQVTVNKGGKEFKLPLENLSDGDQAFIKEWLEKKDAPAAKPDIDAPPPAAGGITFDGKPFTLGGKVNIYEYEYSPEKLAAAKKNKGNDTGYKIAIAVPADFDPAKPQKVFIPCTAENNAQQVLAGNVGMMNFFAKQCVASGWVCIAYDSNIGRVRYDGDMVAAWEKINSVWPQFKTWSFAVGGFSGGAKACFAPCGYLIKNGYKVSGAFLAGCNYDTSGEYQDIYRVPKSAYKDVKVFVGNPAGKSDYAPPVVSSLKKNGMSNVRSEVHQGGSSLDYGHLASALKWFAE